MDEVMGFVCNILFCLICVLVFVLLVGGVSFLITQISKFKKEYASTYELPEVLGITHTAGGVALQPKPKNKIITNSADKYADVGKIQLRYVFEDGDSITKTIYGSVRVVPGGGTLGMDLNKPYKPDLYLPLDATTNAYCQVAFYGSLPAVVVNDEKKPTQSKRGIIKMVTVLEDTLESYIEKYTETTITEQ